MDVVVVGQKWIAFATYAMKEYSQNIKTWYHQWRKGYD
jgi:hypothetical protein